MMLGNLNLVVALGVLAGGSHGHRAPRPVRCDACVVESPGVLRQIAVLRDSPKEDDREEAAEKLRDLDWRTHPEAVLALADALVLDRSDDVREEAAESLGRMRPFVPSAHEALLRASMSDPDKGVRKQARKALEGLGRRCVVDCPACGPLPVGSPIQGPTIIPPEWMPFLAPASVTGPVPAPNPAEETRLEPLPSPLPDAPPALSDEPPPPPTPVRVEGPIGRKSRRAGSSPTRVR